MTSESDKRSSKRIRRTFVMRVTLDDGNPWPRWSLVTTHDFSAGGALFTVDQVLQKGARLLCRIHFASTQIDCKARVIRVLGAAQSPIAQVAVSFEWADEKDRLYVEDFAKHYVERK